MSERPNLFPALDGATEAALRESIQRFGVLVPVVRDQHGGLIDGHHRSRIASELGVNYRVDTVSVASDDEAREIGATLNTDRRQMSAEQRREVVGALREQGHSLRAIGGAVGVSKDQVANDIEAEELSTGRQLAPDRTTGLDGKSRPSKRPNIVASKTPREAERVQEALKTAPVPAGRVIDSKRAERLAREAASERRSSEPVEATEVGDEEIATYHCDFRDLPVDLDLIGAAIITDPPYPREFLDVWEALGKWGLDEGCELLVAMCGQSILPDALELIKRASRIPVDEHMDLRGWSYRWCGAYLTAGPATRVEIRHRADRCDDCPERLAAAA